MARPCIFCGSTINKSSKEHTIGNWIATLFRNVYKDQITAGIISPDGTVHWYRAPLFQQTTRKVCKPCNNGWMSRLETSVQPLLGPMMLNGAPTKLEIQFQKILATWAVKTAFMLQQIQGPKRIVPDSEYGRLYAVQQPPRGYGVWIAHRAILTDNAGREVGFQSLEEPVYEVLIKESYADDFRKNKQPNDIAFVITFTIGYVVFQVFGHNMPGNFQIGLDAAQGVLNWIWPQHDGDITWPAANSIEKIGGLLVMHKGLSRGPQSAPDLAPGNVEKAGP